MIIDLTALKGSQLSFEYSLEPEEIDLEGEPVKLKDAVKISGDVTRRAAQTEVAGKILADVLLECSRCLQAVEESLEIEFDTVFVTPEFFPEGKETELQQDDLEVDVFAGDEIDLTELIREQILLNLPTQVFCREDCKGFCDKCGANLNLINCNCEENEIDPRWQSLRELKNKNE